MSVGFGSRVTVIQGGHPGYPVTGVIGNFIMALTAQGELVDCANITVTADAGLYRQGDLITVPVAELEAAARAAYEQWPALWAEFCAPVDEDQTTPEASDG